MRYLDANVFVYAALDATPRGARARGTLRRLVTGKEPGVTAALTLDEVVWAIQRATDRATALRQGSRVLAMPHLRVLDVRARDVVTAIDLMEQHDRLDPRDGIHAAVCLGAGVFSIVSDDDDFDVIPGLERIPL